MPADHAPPIFYTALQRKLHWVVIVLLASQYAFQGFMRDALAVIERQETLSLVPFLVSIVHTWGGATIAVLMMWRWRLRKRAVPLNGGDLTLSKARWVSIHHHSLYLVTVTMAASGALHYYVGVPLAARWHELGKWLLLGLIVIHIIGALSHVGSGNRVLQRMMGRDSLR